MTTSILLRKYVSNTTTLFIKRNTIAKVGYYDQSIRLLEDYPLWFKLTGAGVKIYYLDKFTTKYRTNYNSVSYDLGKHKIINSIYKYNILVSKKYIIPNIKGIERAIEIYRLYITSAFINSAINRDWYLGRTIWFLLYMPCNLSKKRSLSKLYKKIDASLI